MILETFNNIPLYRVLIAMIDLLESEPFLEVKETLYQYVQQINNSNSITLFANADLDSIIGLSFIEAAFLDANIPYARKILTSRIHHQKGDSIELENNSGLCLIIEPNEDTWEINSLDLSENLIKLVPLSISVRQGESNKKRRGALDSVLQCAVIAYSIAPNGSRVRRLRPHIASGLWLRKSLDNTFDPVHTWIRDQLRDEGTINVVPLPDVPSPVIDMLEGISKNMLNRLSKKWQKMDASQRSQALSELALPCLEKCKLSTPRLEELIWHRVLVGGSEQDLHSQIYTAEQEWPTDIDDSKKYARRVLTSLISSGFLNP